MQAATRELPLWGTMPMVFERAQMYQQYGFRDEMMGPDAAEFVAEFCENNKIRARDLGREAQAICGNDDNALIRLAGRLKYLNSWLNLAESFGKQIAIMSENLQFRAQALSYVSLAYAELEALEHFGLEML